MSKEGNPYDLSILKKVFAFAKPYKGVFALVTLTAIGVSAFAVARPKFLQLAIDLGIQKANSEVLLKFTSLMLLALVLEVTSQLTFIYFSNWLGQHIVNLKCSITIILQ